MPETTNQEDFGLPLGKYKESFKAYESAQKPRLEELGKAEEEKAKIEAEGVKKGYERLQTGEKEYKEKVKEVPVFEPTRESVGDLVRLFATLGVVAFGSGGKGRYSGTAAMNNLASAMEGYKKGQKDLFQREMQEFDKNLKSVLETNRQAAEELRHVAELARMDPVMAQSQARVYGAKYAGTKLQYDFEKTSWDQKLKTATHLDDAAQKLELARAKLEAKEAQEGFRKMTEKDSTAQINRVAISRELKEAIPILDKVYQSGQWNKLSALLALPGGARFAEFAAKNNEELKKQGLDDDAIKLLRTFARFRSKEFDTAGKALTQREDDILAPLYQASFRDYNAVRNSMEQGLKVMDFENKASVATVSGMRRLMPLLEEEADQVFGRVTSKAPISSNESDNLTDAEKKELEELRKKHGRT